MTTPSDSSYSDARFIREHFLVPGLMLALAIMVIPLSLMEGLRPSHVMADNWFSRAGAVVAVFSLIADVVLLKTFEFLHPRGMGCRRIAELREKYRPALDWISRGAVTLSIVGTIIWGYGDLFYVWLQNC